MDDALAKGSFSYYLEPGFIYFSETPATIRTVLGSCVSVCLWDQERRYGGMNHFIYPSTTDPEKATPQYGNVATAGLIGLMQKAGSKTEDLVAQVTGGAHPEPIPKGDVSRRNIEVARAVLDRKGIAIASEDTGGNMGRKVVFDTETGQLVTLKVHRLRSEDWVTGVTMEDYSGMRRSGMFGASERDVSIRGTRSEGRDI